MNIPSKFHSYWDTTKSPQPNFQSFKVSKFQSFKVSKFQSFKVSSTFWTQSDLEYPLFLPMPATLCEMFTLRNKTLMKGADQKNHAWLIRRMLKCSQVIQTALPLEFISSRSVKQSHSSGSSNASTGPQLLVFQFNPWFSLRERQKRILLTWSFFCACERG